MQRIFIIVALTVATFLCACGEPGEKTASRDYVKATKKMMSAQSAYAEADYSTSLALCTQVLDDAENIVMKYSETPIALKILTDGSTRIGACTFSELNNVVIPRLKKFTAKEMYPVELAWVLALSTSPELRDAAMSMLAVHIINGKDFDKSKRDTVILCAAEIVDSSKKGEVLRRLRDKLAPKVDAPAPQVPAIAIAPKNKIADEKTFIAQANSDAALVAYDMQAIENLRQKALLASDASDTVRAEFAKSLKTANDNVMKISAADMRERAFATLAFAFSNFGDEHNAIAIAQTLKAPKLFADVFDAIAKQASSGKNYTLAISLASRLQNGKSKNDFMVELSKGVAAQGLFAESISIAEMLKDVPARNLALANIAKIAFAKNDKKSLAAAISKIDLQNQDLSWTDTFEFLLDKENPALFAKENLHFKRAISLGNLAEILIADGAVETAKAVNASGFALCGTNIGFPIFFNNMAALGDSVGAINYIALNMSQIPPETASNILCGIAENIVVKDKASALRAYALAANLCNSLSGVSRMQSSIQLALSLQRSGIERGECARLLKPFLPAFN